MAKFQSIFTRRDLSSIQPRVGQKLNRTKYLCRSFFISKFSKFQVFSSWAKVETCPIRCPDGHVAQHISRTLVLFHVSNGSSHETASWTAIWLNSCEITEPLGNLQNELWPQIVFGAKFRRYKVLICKVPVSDYVKSGSRCRLSRAHNWPGVMGIWDGEGWGGGMSVHE